jgi:hypothetical protein
MDERISEAGIQRHTNPCPLIKNIYIYVYIQGDSPARGPKVMSIKNFVIEIMT